MKKEALIKIIINDLKEVENLMEAFKGEATVSDAFLNLAKSKIKNINDEIDLLKTEFSDNPVTTVKEEFKIEEPVRINEEKNVKTAEPADVKKETPVTEKEPESLKEEVLVESGKPAEKKSVEIKKETVKEDQTGKNDISGNEVKTGKAAPEKKDIEPRKGPPKVKENAKKENKTIADVLQKNKSALNEKIELKETENDIIFAKPVNDVRQAMGINDRFLFQRELFNGNSDLFDHTLDQINSMSSFEDASRFLHSNFNWDKDSDVTSTFFRIVKRRFL
jgi:hypothetical protein